MTPHSRARLPHLDTNIPSNHPTENRSSSCSPLRRRSTTSSTASRGPRRSIFKEVDVDGTMGEARKSRYPASAMHADMDGNHFQVEQRYYPFDLHQEKSTTMPFVVAETEVEFPRTSTKLYRLYILAILMVLSVPMLLDIPLFGTTRASIFGVKAGAIRRFDVDNTPTRTGLMAKRSDSPTDVCNRWGHQSALVNGTIYVYGGHASQEQDQGTSGTWTNDFFSMDVTKDFQISSPTLKGLPQPSGPPAVANAYLWQSYDTLYLYGGEVSDTPRAYPQPYSLWAYDIPSGQWTEHSNPKTSAGNNSDDGNQPVQQASEGAGVSVPQLGRGYYFAGHLDAYNTPGWPLPIPRVYLKSMIEYTFPGFTNDGVQSLGGGKKAGNDGVWRNITQGGIQDTSTFTIRADSAVVYVPGFGDQGILLSLGGGTNISFVRHSSAIMGYLCLTLSTVSNEHH